MQRISEKFIIAAILLFPLFILSPCHAVDIPAHHQELSAWVDSWRKAWEKGDRQEYISFYSVDAIQNERRGRAVILAHKRRLWSKSPPESIELISLKAFLHPRGILLTFTQRYKSEGLSDQGYKTLLLAANAQSGKKWLILEENWYPREPALSYPEIEPPRENTDEARQGKIAEAKKLASVKETDISASAVNEEKSAVPLKEEESAPLAVSLPVVQVSPEKSDRPLFAFPAWVDDIRLVPSAAIKQAYNDNVYFTTANRKGDWVSTVTPGLELTGKTEKMDAGISVRFNGIYYVNQQDLNAVDQFYKGKLRYALTDRLALGAEAGFSRDSQAAREIDTTGVIFASPVIRERQNYGATGDWRMTERTVAGFSCNYGKDRYDQTGFTDLTSQVVGLSFMSDVDKTTKGRLNLGYANYSVTGATVDSYNGTIGISRDFTNLWSVLIDTGAVYTHTRFNILAQEQANEGWGPMGQITIAGKLEKMKGSLTLSRSVMPVTGTSGTANRTYLGLNIQHKFTYELSGYLTVGYFINKSDRGEFSNTVIDQNSMQVVIGPRYEFNKDMYVAATYNYSRVDYGQTETQIKASAEQHLFLLTFNISHTLLE